MNFLYYIPKASDASAVELRAVGHALDGPPAVRETTRGPDGGPGHVLGRAAAPGSVGYWPDRHTWRPLRPGEPAGAWLGYDPADLPTPADLLRREPIDGYEVTLEGRDGPSRWLVPVARIFPEGTNLPAALAIGPGGALVKEPLARYAAACRLAERLWDHVLAGQDGRPPTEPMTDAEEFAAACEILALNYRVGPAEMSALGALTTANLPRVLFLFVDLPAYLAATDDGKKNETTLTAPGPAAPA